MKLHKRAFFTLLQRNKFWFLRASFEGTYIIKSPWEPLIFRKFYPLKDKKSELSEVFMAKKVKDCIWVTIGTISERNMLRIHTFYAIYLVLTHRVNRYYMEFNWKGPVQKWIQWIFHPLMWYLKLLNINRLVPQWQKTRENIQSLTEIIIQIVISRT